MTGWGWYPALGKLDVAWPGRQRMGVDVYSRYPSVRLYLNGKLVGERPTTRKQNFQATFTLPYQPGTLKAVGVENGQETEPMQLVFVSESTAIRLTSSDCTSINAELQDLSFIQVDVLAGQGRVQTIALMSSSVSFASHRVPWHHRRPRQCLAQNHGAVPRHHLPRLSLLSAVSSMRGSKTAGTLDLKADGPGLASSDVANPCR